MAIFLPSEPCSTRNFRLAQVECTLPQDQGVINIFTDNVPYMNATAEQRCRQPFPANNQETSEDAADRVGFRGNVSHTNSNSASGLLSAPASKRTTLQLGYTRPKGNFRFLA